MIIDNIFKDSIFESQKYICINKEDQSYVNSL